MQGLFITLEGPEGAGKTTVLKQLSKQLENQINCEIVLTREPGGIGISEKIRDVLLSEESVKMDSRTEALLYAASRRQHLVEKVIPALNKKQLVLCDRFIDSSIAYQGYGRSIGADLIENLNDFAIEGHYPNLTLYLDIEPELGLERIHGQRKNEINRLDQESLEFHKTVRNGYLSLAKKYSDRIYLVDANQTVEEVTQACFNIIKVKYPQLFASIK